MNTRWTRDDDDDEKRGRGSKEGKRQRSAIATRSIALQSCLSRQYLLIAEHQVQVTRAPQAPCSSFVILKFERGLPLVSNKEETELGLRISRGGL